MNTRKNNHTAMGMILGTALGGAFGIVVYALTGQPWWIAMAGAGTGIGLSLGAGMDRRNQ